MTPSTTFQDGSTDGAEDQYTLLREAGPIEAILCLYTELNLSSNILVVATYSSRKRVHLDRQCLLPALEIVVKQHPALGLIAVSQGSNNKKGETRIWEARLRNIDLEKAVDFVDDVDDSEDGLRSIIEKSHNEWYFEPGNTERPHWRLKVVNGRHVFFIYEHFIADGLSGYAFHRCLLAALNSPTNKAASTPLRKGKWTIPVPEAEPIPYWTEDTPIQLSIPALLLTLLFLYIIRLWFPISSLFFADSVVDMTPVSISSPVPMERRPKTRVLTLRIPAGIQSDALRACKRNGTTFTATLHTLVMVALATDVYPNSRLGTSYLPTNLRHYTRSTISDDAMGNFASAYSERALTAKYRKAAQPSLSEGQRHGLIEKDHAPVVNPAHFWALSRAYRERLRYDINIKHRGYNNHLGMSLAPQDKEKFFGSQFPNLARFVRHSFLLSNLGPFTSVEPSATLDEPVDPDASNASREAESRWSIVATEFSSAVVKSSYGNCGVVFSVAGVKDGDCVMNISYEEGVQKRENVEKALDGIQKRLELLIEDENITESAALKD